MLEPRYDPCMTYEHSITARSNQLGVDFAEGGKPEYPEKNPRSQIENDKSQPRIRSRVHRGGRRERYHSAVMTALKETTQKPEKIVGLHKQQGKGSRSK